MRPSPNAFGPRARPSSRAADAGRFVCQRFRAMVHVKTSTPTSARVSPGTRGAPSGVPMLALPATAPTAGATTDFPGTARGSACQAPAARLWNSPRSAVDVPWPGQVSTASHERGEAARSARVPSWPASWVAARLLGWRAAALPHVRRRWASSEASSGWPSAGPVTAGARRARHLREDRLRGITTHAGVGHRLYMLFIVLAVTT
jgi:hypothetical protein